MNLRDRAEQLGETLRATEALVPTSRLGRLWKTGKSAARMANTMLRRRSTGDEDAARIVRMVSEIGELKGVAMKAGQILGYIDPTLDAQLRAHFSVLQTSSPAMPFATIEATIRDAFGERADELLAGMEREPMAVASIGQVHRGRLADGTRVAVKVRHAGIDKAMANDFRAAGAGSAFAALLAPGGSGDSIRSMVSEARTAMLEECDYELEAERQETFARHLAGNDAIIIPRVIRAWSAKTVLTTEWTPGETLEGFLSREPSQASRDRVAEALFVFYVGTLYRHGLFHADPHPGNLAVREGGQVVIYDFGCVRSFDAATVAALARLSDTVRGDDAAEMVDAFAAVGAARPTSPEATSQLRALLRGFFGPMLVSGKHPIDLSEGMEAGQMIRDKQAMMKLELPGKLLFLFRLRFGLYAVLSRLGAELDWASLESQCARARPPEHAPRHASATP